ncbi:MAG: hypothetical protein ABFR62_08470 [Bacteroidota bacterium]
MLISEIINPEIRSKIAWYPSSGLDFRDLLVLGQKEFVFDKDVFANELFEFEFLPDLFIHTDKAYNSDNWPLPESGVIFKDDESEYTILNSEDVYSDAEEVLGKFLSIKLKHKLLKSEIRQEVLFLFSDNMDFFKKFVLKRNIGIDFLINIRDGASENGGADYSLKMLEFFLGKMNTGYLISDNFGRSPYDMSELDDSQLLLEAYYSKENKPVVLQGLKEWSWSEFGTFRGDAFLIKIHHLGNGSIRF